MEPDDLKVLRVYLRKSQLERLRVLAAKSGTSMSDYVKKLLEEADK